MTAALEGGEWSAAHPGRTLPPGKTRCPFYRRLAGPQDRSGRAENFVPTGIGSRTVQPVVSRYTDWATWRSRIYMRSKCCTHLSFRRTMLTTFSRPSLKILYMFRDFTHLPSCKWDLSSFETLCSVDSKFRTTFRYNPYITSSSVKHCRLLGLWPLTTGPICCSETWVRIYHSTLRKIPKQRWSLSYRSGH